PAQIRYRLRHATLHHMVQQRRFIVAPVCLYALDLPSRTEISEEVDMLALDHLQQSRPTRSPIEHHVELPVQVTEGKALLTLQRLLYEPSRLPNVGRSQARGRQLEGSGFEQHADFHDVEEIADIQRRDD